MAKAPLIEGLTAISHGELARVNAGELHLPSSFDVRRFAVKWAKMGTGVERSRQEEILTPKLKAAGWTVWKDPKTHRNCRKTLSTGVHLLLCRKKELQDTINAVYGNTSRERLMNEQQGITANGDVPHDPGVLTNQYLNQFPQFAGETSEGLPLKFNEIAIPEEAAAGRAASKTSRSK